jgi:glycerol-3-phosphate dehydrogenase
MGRAKKFFPVHGASLAASRLGAEGLSRVVDKLEKQPSSRQLVCECENVTLAEVEEAAADPTSFTLSDVRRKTRMGMGTCQGAFCTYRTVGTMVANDLTNGQDSKELLKDFIEARWKGIRHVLWGNAIRETELTRGIYEGTLNVNGAMKK